VLAAISICNVPLRGPHVEHAECSHATCHKSIEETESLTPMYESVWRIKGTDDAPIASAMCAVETELAPLRFMLVY
jgi:hypothetical protein